MVFPRYSPVILNHIECFSSTAFTETSVVSNYWLKGEKVAFFLECNSAFQAICNKITASSRLKTSDASKIVETRLPYKTKAEKYILIKSSNFTSENSKSNNIPLFLSQLLQSFRLIIRKSA